MKSFDILVAGEINPDLILSGDVVPEFGQVEKLVERATLTVGSSSAIFACGAARLELRVAFVGVCGEDIFARFMLDAMRERGIDVSHVIRRSDGQTGLSVILNQSADRAILTYPGLISALQASDVSDALLQQARHLHVASYFLQKNLQPDLPDLFRRAHALGLTTSLDTNYDPSETWMGFEDLLSTTDILFPNKAEALSIARSRDLRSAARQLANRSKTVVIKLGGEGGVLQAGNDFLSMPSIPVDVVDTIGAGDAFDAGFLYGYLNRWDLKLSLQMAVICGSLSTRRSGGTAAQPTLEEALAYLK